MTDHLNPFYVMTPDGVLSTYKPAEISDAKLPVGSFACRKKNSIYQVGNYIDYWVLINEAGFSGGLGWKTPPKNSPGLDKFKALLLIEGVL